MLMVTFVAISVFGTVFSAYFLYQQASTTLNGAVYSKLTASAQFKASHLKTYLTGIKRGTAQGASRVTFSKLLTTDKNSPGYNAALDTAQNSIEQLQKTDPSYDEVFLMGMDGRIVISSNKNTIGTDKSADPFFTDGQKNVTIKDVYFSDVTGRPQLGASSPVFDSSGKVVGVYAARINLEEMDQIMSDRTGLGDSGEMLLINRQSYAITPLRYMANAVLNIKVNTTMAQTCLKDMAEYYNATDEIMEEHNDTAMIFSDYRGVTSVGTHSYALPQAAWCVIAKMDEAEALGQPRDALLGSFIFVSLLAIIAMSIAIYFVSRSLSRQIRDLSDEVDRITKGNLGIVLKQSSITELQSLTNSLNRVLASLKLAVLRTGLSHDDMGLGEALAAKNEAEDRLSAAKEMQQAALDSLSDTFFVCDTAGRFLSWNKAFRDATGYSDKEISNMRTADFFSGEDIVHVASAIRKGLKSGSATVRASVLTKDKRRLPTEFSGSVLKGEGGKIIGFAGVGRRLAK